MYWSKICSQRSMTLENLARVLCENEDRFDYESVLWMCIADGLLSNDIHLIKGDAEKIHGVFEVRSAIRKKLTTMEIAQRPEFFSLQQIAPYFSHSHQTDLDALTQIEAGLCNEIEQFIVFPIEVIDYLHRTESGKNLLPSTLLEYLTQHMHDILAQLKAELSNAEQEPTATDKAQTEATLQPQQPLEAEKHIEAWAAVLPKLKGAELAAAKLAIEKWRKKSHEDAYRAAIPDGCAATPKEYVSKKKSTAEEVAKRYNLLMPNWQSEA